MAIDLLIWQAAIEAGLIYHAHQFAADILAQFVKRNRLYR